ncbi:MAG: GNAT family N-acetyltransferase [Acidimicrobiales bacterium]
MTSLRARRRLFVALEVTGAVANEIDGLRRAIGSSQLGRIAPHVTLVPPVNVREVELSSALGILRSVAHEDPIPVVLGPARSLLPRSPVLYLEIDDSSGRIARLQRRLDASPLSAPRTRPSRPFLAHVTLSSHMERKAISPAVELFSHYQVETVLSALTLYEQHHAEPRHPWHPLADVILGVGTSPDRGGRAFGFTASHRPGPDIATPDEEGALFGGADSVAVIGRDRASVVAQSFGAIVNNQLVIDRWCVDESRRGEGIGRALLSALERTAVALDTERALIASSSSEEESFLSHLGLAAVDGPPSTSSRTWFAHS